MTVGEMAADVVALDRDLRCDHPQCLKLGGGRHAFAAGLFDHFPFEFFLFALEDRGDRQGEASLRRRSRR